MAAVTQNATSRYLALRPRSTLMSWGAVRKQNRNIIWRGIINCSGFVGRDARRPRSWTGVAAARAVGGSAPRLGARGR